MTAESWLVLGNGATARRDAIPMLSVREFHDAVVNAVASGGGRIAALFGAPAASENGGAGNNAIQLIAVIAHAPAHELRVTGCELTNDEYPALTPECPQAHWFEREIAEQWGVRPLGHPWLKPIRFHHSRRTGHDAWNRSPDAPIEPGVTNYYAMQGEEIHEVAVGPVHAGIIEPGHFRFQCHGEHVFHLEISLGYQHRGIERALVGGPGKRAMAFFETLAGDTTLGHGTAYCEIVEALAGCEAGARAQWLRAIALELERLANHTGDLGALAGDVGFLPTASYCGRIRGDFLNMTALLCGNRFGRGLVRPGGVLFDLDAGRAAELRRRLEAGARDVASAVNLLWETPSVLARFERTGALTAEQARELGLVGPAARACGVEMDVRRDFPAGHYRARTMPVASQSTGDVHARAYVRWMEINNAIHYILDSISDPPTGKLLEPARTLAPDSVAVALAEGWRGEICHVALTDPKGAFSSYKIVDPSFHNWFGLAMALREQEISDFPLCNKSFDLSYCGHDL